MKTLIPISGFAYVRNLDDGSPIEAYISFAVDHNPCQPLRGCIIQVKSQSGAHNDTSMVSQQQQQQQHPTSNMQHVPQLQMPVPMPSNHQQQQFQFSRSMDETSSHNSALPQGIHHHMGQPMYVQSPQYFRGYSAYPTASVQAPQQRNPHTFVHMMGSNIQNGRLPGQPNIMQQPHLPNPTPEPPIKISRKSSNTERPVPPRETPIEIPTTVSEPVSVTPTAVKIKPKAAQAISVQAPLPAPVSIQTAPLYVHSTPVTTTETVNVVQSSVETKAAVEPKSDAEPIHKITDPTMIEVEEKPVVGSFSAFSDTP
ncbi:hypothetical protein RCL1_008503 [Eukaryota sp. TZLM3-RCL]